MQSAVYSTRNICLQGSPRGVTRSLRSCAASAQTAYPRQRNLDISCSLQSVTGSFRHGHSESKKDRLHVIALISEAVSVNVSVQPSPAVVAPNSS